MITSRPAASPESIAALNRARDLDVQTAQGSKKLVFSLCGNVYECMSGITDPTLDLEPKPRREHPNSRISFAVKDADGQRRSLLRRMDITESSHPPQAVYHQSPEGEMQVSMVPGVFAGLEAQHPFQVMYAGRGTWAIGAGTISVDQNTIQLGKDNIYLNEGWICLWTAWDVPAANDYSLLSAGFTSVSDFSTVQPTQWSLDNGVLRVGRSTVLFPIAYVNMNWGGRPLIQQTITNDLSFFPLTFPWGLLGPRYF